MMKLFFDFFPIVIFFIAYKFFGIYIATGAAIALSVLQVGGYWLKHRQIPAMQLLSLILIVVFGGITLLLHNEMFIKWKPTVLYWALAVIFLGSQLFCDKSFIQRLMESNITLPPAAWRHLNIAWVLFFSIMGIVNLFVIYHFSTNAWVNFKLFGMLGLTLIFAIAQGIYLARYIGVADPRENEKLP
jgi:intracellular septation protein